MNTTTRRKVLSGAAALPLLPAVALAVPATLPLLPVPAFATPGNATDTAWSAYEAAKANYEATYRDYTAMEASLPEHLKLKVMPNWTEYPPGEWRIRVDAWNRDRAERGAQAVGEACETLRRMVMAGDLTKEARGLYHIKSDPLDPPSGESGCQERKPEPDKLTDLTGVERGEL